MPLGGALSIRADEEILPATAGAGPRGLPAGKYVRVDVVDTGLGMDEATLARATEPFFTTKGPGKGTGLGLSMVQGLAVQSGGAMAVESQVGRGTVISLWLPQAERMRVEVLAEERASVQNGAGADTGPELTVLVVDDDLLVSAGTAAMLEDLGHKVVEASSGSSALDQLQRLGPGIDMVITDHAMPGMTGLDLAQRIRESYPQLPVILASGYADLREEPEQSALPRLPKPFRQSDLAAVIASTLEQAPRHGHARQPGPALAH
jgi:CheY-like chemotaxis protein